MHFDAWKVRELIATQQRSVSEVAQAAGLTLKNFDCALRRGSCRLATLGKIAAALGVSVRDLWIVEED